MSVASEAQDPSCSASGRKASRRTSLGALANSGASALRLAVQFGVLPILARLIGPSEYGLVALAMPVVLLANVISDGGLTAALGRQRDADRTTESTAFWVTLGVGSTLALAACLSAFPIGWALRQPRLPWLIMALSPTLLMNSITSVSNGRIIRERRFATFAAGDVLSTLAGAATALFAATHGCGAWSLVAQQLALWIAKLTWITSRGGAQIGFQFRYSAVRELVTFGANNIGSTIADFVARNVDNMIIGGVLGAERLGFYAMAYQVIRLPDMLITGPFWLYVFTAMSRAAHQGDRAAIRDLARAGLRLSAALLAPLFLGLALVADLGVVVTLGAKWSGAVGPLRLLAAAGFGFCICSMVASILMGLGKAALQFRLSTAQGITTIVTVGSAVWFGLEPASGALACGVWMVGFYYLDQLARDLKTSRASLLTALAPALAGCVALAAAVLGVRELLHAAPPGVRLAGAIPAGAAAYVAVIWALARRQLLADARLFGRAHADARASGSEAAVAKAEELQIEAESGLNPVG
jgi:PST family polysaccharide transporter